MAHWISGHNGGGCDHFHPIPHLCCPGGPPFRGGMRLCLSVGFFLKIFGFGFVYMLVSCLGLSFVRWLCLHVLGLDLK